ncbi:hypothetical protein BDDG_12373, partial [Blastomyces dermatitidis ATCC 18188]
FSHVDRSASADDSEFSVESLIKNLKNVIIEKLSVSCVTESSAFLSVFSVSFSAAFSQSSTSVSVPGSSLTTPVPATLTSATSGFIISAFIISSSHFKKILYRLNESSLSAFASVSEVILIEDDNTAETTLSHFQASSIAFSLSLFSVRKVVHIL